MEPERRIEKWLRAFAKKRREQAGAPLELRPAARQQLQREVARQSEEKSDRGFFAGFFFGLRPKLAFAACFAALTLSAWFLFRPPSGPQPATLAMNNKSYSEPLPNAIAPETPPPAVTSPTIASADKKVLDDIPASAPPATRPTAASANRTRAVPNERPKEADRFATADEQQQLTIATTAASAPSTNLYAAVKKENAADSLVAAGALSKDSAGALPTIAAAPASNLIAGTAYAANAQTLSTTASSQRALAVVTATNTALFDLAKATDSVTLSQTFKRLDASARRDAAAALKVPAPVLTSFRMEKNGDNLKVIDADGSVYTGLVQIAPQQVATEYSFAAAENAPTGSAQKTKAPTSMPAQQNYFFRVTGTNQNSQQNIVFSGNFVPFTSSQLAGNARAAGGGAGGGGNAQPAVQPVQPVLLNSEINGNVVIDGQKAIEVIAAPVR